MIDLKKLADLLAAAPMSPEERAAFVRLVPQLSMRQLEPLIAMLKRQVAAIRKVRADGKKAMGKLLDEKKIEKIQKKIKSKVD